MDPKKQDFELSPPSIDSSKDNAHGGNSVLGTFFNIVCVTAGIGMLSLPKSLAKGGWGSLPFIVIAGLMAIYTSHLLIKCKYPREGVRLETFPEIGQEAFGTPGRILVQFCHYSIILGSACLLVIVAAQSAGPVAEFFKFNLDYKIWTLLAGAVVIIPYCAMRTIKEFVWMAMFGFLTTLVTLVICVIVSFQNIPKEQVTTQDINWSGFPSALAVFSLSYCGNVVHPHLEGAMKEPRKWNWALAAGLLTSAGFYVLMSSVGYAVFGTTVKSPIYNSLPNEIPVTIARILMTMHVLLAAPIYLCSFGLELENSLNIVPEKIGNPKATIIRVCTRALTVGIIILISAFVPHLMEFMEILGAFSNCINLFFVPIACHIKLFGFKNRPIYEYIFMGITLIVATVCLGFGGYNSIVDMAAAIAKDNL